MNGLWTIASLTIKEATRRRLFVVTLLVAVIFVLWALIPLPMRTSVGSDLDTGRDATGKVFAWMGCGMIKFFSTIMAIMLASGAISSEAEKGVLSIVISKPLNRFAIYLGKWLGLAGMLAANVAFWGALLILVILRQTHTFHVHILLGLAATYLFPLVFMTLTLWFSTFASSPLAAGLSFIFAGIALAEDILSQLATVLNAPVLTTVSNVVGYVVPLGKMNHWITRGLGDAGTDLTSLSFGGSTAVVTSTSDLVYILGYIIVALALGAFIFQKRDL
jgi:ABC-type transport system involved in multi-copper enzyme maturation permease subunit